MVIKQYPITTDFKALHMSSGRNYISQQLLGGLLWELYFIAIVRLQLYSGLSLLSME